MHLVMFDIDGTLVDSAGFEGALYEQAVKTYLDVPVDRTWAAYEHVSDSGILEQLLREADVEGDRAALAVRIKQRFIESVRAHTTLGASILAPVRAYRDLMPLVRSHHELLDGSGYPDGLAGDQIPPLVRIMTVADIFDALVSDRPYRDALPLVEAVALFRQGAGVKFDGRVLGGFFRVLAAGHADVEELYPHLTGQLIPAVPPAIEQDLLGRWT